MIPVSPHGEFAPTEFAPTINFLFRVRPKLFEVFSPRDHGISGNRAIYEVKKELPIRVPKGGYPAGRSLESGCNKYNVI